MIYCLLAGSFSVISVFAISNVSNKFGQYDEAIKIFATNEENALWIYEIEPTEISEEWRQYYKNRINREGILLWEENVTVLSALLEIDYPQELRDQLNILIEYSKLRKRTCELILELMDNPIDSLKNELLIIFEQMRDKIKETEDQ